MNMTDEQMRIAIAEACGWKFKQLFLGDPYGTAPKSWLAKHDPAHWNRELYELPDYLNDLNAMHEAERVLDDGRLGGLYDRFELELAEVCYQEGKRRSMIHATARQRAEAFIRTLNLETA